MNRPGPAPRCLVCHRNLTAVLASAGSDAEREDAARQVLNGLCDTCQRARYEAAVEFERAAAQIRLAWEIARARFGPSGAVAHDPVNTRWGTLRTPGGVSWERIMDDYRRCADLRMWNDADRKYTVPDRFVERPAYHPRRRMTRTRERTSA